MITDELLFEVAVAYYYKNKLQREIASDLGVSRVQVSKYLTLARERGIVGVTVNSPWVDGDEKQELELLFKQGFGIDTLILSPKISHEDVSYTFLIKHAANYLQHTLTKPDLKVGIGWGKTLHDLSGYNNLAEPKSNWTLFPLAVPPTSDDLYFSYSALSRRFKKNWGVRVNNQLLQRLASREAYLRNRDEVVDEWKQMDALIFSIGMPFTRLPSSRDHLFPKETHKKLQSLNIMGDVINNYFDIDGNLFIPKSSELISIPYDLIKVVPRRIGIAAGVQKIPSIIGACRSNLLETLITDITTARRVMEYFE